MVLAGDFAQAAGGGDQAAAAARKRAIRCPWYRSSTTSWLPVQQASPRWSWSISTPEFKSQISNPAHSDFGQRRDPVLAPDHWRDESGLPSWAPFPTCTAAALSATPGNPALTGGGNHVFAPTVSTLPRPTAISK